MSVETKPNRLTKGLVLDTFHTDVDNTVATYALNSQLEDQEGNHFHYGSEVGTNHIKDIPDNHVVIGHINMERNETVLFTTDGTNSTIGILSRNDDMSYKYEIKVDDTDQKKKLGFKKEGYVRGVYRLLNGCDKVIYFVDGINKDRRVNFNQLNSYKDPVSTASEIIFDDSLRATMYALSSVTGNIQLIRLMSASAEATANVLATLTSGESLTKLLTASANGIGTAFANLTRTANMISSTDAIGTTTANVDIIRLLQSNISAIGSVNAVLESSQQGVVEIDVTLTGVASSTAILLRTAILETNLTTEASTVVDAILTRIINAQFQATANTSATAQLTVPLNVSASATANTAADAILSYAVNATANAMAETSATAQLSKVITASMNATASSSVEALIGLVLISTSTANGSVSTANLFINRLLTSSVTATGATTAEAIIAKLLQSSLTASANTTANSLVSKLLVANVSATATVTDANFQLFDPNFSSVSLLLHCNGADGSTSFIDNSISPSILTGVGNTQLDTTFKQFGTASIQFDGTGDRITTGSNAKFSFGTGNFTVEGWFYENNKSLYATFIEIGNHLNSNGIIFLTKNGNNTPTRFGIYSGAFFGNDLAPNLNSWNHIAWVRNNGVLRMYVNGVGGTAVSFTNNLTDTATITIGSRSGGNADYDFNGYIDEIRITKGVARYTAASFTVPTREFLDQ